MRIPNNLSHQEKHRVGKLPKQQPSILIILKDKTAVDNMLSAEVEEELKWQRSRGTHFFDELVELIKSQADEQIRAEDEDEDEDEDRSQAAESKN